MKRLNSSFHSPAHQLRRRLWQPLDLIAKVRYILIVYVHEVENCPRCLGNMRSQYTGMTSRGTTPTRSSPLEPRKNRTRIAKDYGQSRTLEGNIEAHRLDRSVPRVARNGIVVPPSFLRFLELGVAEVGNDVKP